MCDSNDLCRLGGDIADAINAVDQARALAAWLVGADPENHDPGWPAMSALVDKLEAVGRLLGDLPGDEIAGAIREANEDLDHLSDLADGQSY